jgi:hypothetical protein
MNRLPDFLVVGAAKSGTTALYHYLNQHPEVFLSPIKETNFFALKDKELSFNGPGDDKGIHRRSITDIIEYKNQFINVTTEKAVGEICPSYLYFEDAPKNIKEHIPKVKIIAILREPVARAFSAWVHLTRDGREYLSFKEALADEPRRIKENWAEIWHYKEESKYYDQLKRYYDSFPKENIKVVIYEDFKKNQMRVYGEICNFIGVKSSFVPSMSAKHNKGGIPKNKIIWNLMMKQNIWKTLFNHLMPIKIRKMIKEKIEARNVNKKPQLDKNKRKELSVQFRDEINKIEQLIEQDLTVWKLK